MSEGDGTASTEPGNEVAQCEVVKTVRQCDNSPPVVRNWRKISSLEAHKLQCPSTGGRFRASTSNCCNADHDEFSDCATGELDDDDTVDPEETAVTEEEEDVIEREHILIPIDEFHKFMKSFVCSRCRRRLATIHRDTIGLATKMTYKCLCGKYSELNPEMGEPMDVDVMTGNWKRRVSSYAVNVRLLLATQMIGGSQQAGQIIGSMLSLSHSVFKNAWHKLEDRVGIPIRAITDEILTENIEEEKRGSAPDENGYTPIDVSGDGGWQTRGKSYDSLSGQTMLIGKINEKVLAYTSFAKSCIKCDIAAEKDAPAAEHDCPRNYTGSSKGMESAGLLKCVLKLHNEHAVVIRNFVIDDDTATKACLRQSYKEKQDAGITTKEDWPRTASGYKKKDYGKLPLSHPEIVFKADTNHRIRTFAAALWKLCAMTVSVCALTGVDCHRLKRNFAYWLYTYSHLSRQEFEYRAPSVVLHHFNDHSRCDSSWCVYVKNGADVAKKTGKYRSKKEHAKLFAQVMKVLDEYTTPALLDEMHHTLSSQKNEAMNRSIMRYAPKTTCFSKTMSLATRIALAIAINSIGFSEFYGRAFKKMGLKTSGHARKLMTRLDRRFQTDKERKQSAKVKRARSASSAAKWRKEAGKLKFDQEEGRIYQSGIGLNGTPNDGEHEPPKKRRSTSKMCRCGENDHSRTSFSTCRLNKKNLLNTPLQATNTTHNCEPTLNTVSTIVEQGYGGENGLQIEDSTEWDGMDFDG